MTSRSVSVCAVIPTFRAASSILGVVLSALLVCDGVVVVDDACPQGSGKLVAEAYSNDPRVVLIAHAVNRGVGAAMKSGIASALKMAPEIIVKIDADGQMDPAFIPIMKGAFERDTSLAFIKGSRFFDARVTSLMPKTRFFGNAVLSLFTKAASGYWNLLDPTNGYIAFRASVLALIPWQSFADSYFFEISVLSELGLKRLPILELEMPTIYTDVPSSLSITRAAFEFPAKLARLTLRRFALQYLVFDVNIGTLYFFVGLLLVSFGFIFGLAQWINGFYTHLPKPIGTVMLAVLPFMMGFQLLLNALMYDVQISPKTIQELRLLEKSGERK